MLKAFFQWLDAHPGSYWLPATLATLLLATQIAFAMRQKERGPTPSLLGCARDALVLFFFIFAWRWPFLLAANAFNPDESQLIAGSITLAHDPVFWRSVDGTTSATSMILPLRTAMRRLFSGHHGNEIISRDIAGRSEW